MEKLVNAIGEYGDREEHRMESAIALIMEKEKRAEEKRHMRKLQIFQRVFCTLAVILLIAFHTGSFMLNSFAKEADLSGKGEPCYVSIKIEKGDSLWSIASRYYEKSHMNIPEYVEELKKMNQLNTDLIHAGHYLVVVYYQ